MSWRSEAAVLDYRALFNASIAELESALATARDEKQKHMTEMPWPTDLVLATQEYFGATSKYAQTMQRLHLFKSTHVTAERFAFYMEDWLFNYDRIKWSAEMRAWNAVRATLADRVTLLDLTLNDARWRLRETRRLYQLNKRRSKGTRRRVNLRNAELWTDFKQSGETINAYAKHQCDRWHLSHHRVRQILELLAKRDSAQVSQPQQREPRQKHSRSTKTESVSRGKQSSAAER